MAVTPIVAQLMGAGHKKDVPKAVFQAIYLSFLLSICVIAIGTISIPYVLGGLGLEQSVEDIARHFLSFLAFGIIPLFGYSVLRSFIDALGKTRVTMFITLTALPINFVLNYVFIFGNFGFPKLGGAGGWSCFCDDVLGDFHHEYLYCHESRTICLISFVSKTASNQYFPYGANTENRSSYRVCDLF